MNEEEPLSKISSVASSSSQYTFVTSQSQDSGCFPLPISPLPPAHATAVERERAEQAKKLIEDLLQKSILRRSKEDPLYFGDKTFVVKKEVGTCSGCCIPPLDGKSKSVAELSQFLSFEPNHAPTYEILPTVTFTEVPVRQRNVGTGDMSSRPIGNSPLSVLYEDGDIVVVDKPCGIYCEDIAKLLKVISCAGSEKMAKRGQSDNEDGLYSMDNLDLEEEPTLQCSAIIAREAPDQHETSTSGVMKPSNVTEGYIGLQTLFRGEGANLLEENPLHASSSGRSHNQCKCSSNEVMLAEKNAVKDSPVLAGTAGKGLSSRNNAYKHPSLVHRLDRDTSGAILLAKSSEALKTLSKDFACRRVHKTYVALGAVRGPAPTWTTCTVHTGHGRSRNGLFRVYKKEDVGRLLPGGSKVKEMITRFTVVACASILPQMVPELGDFHSNADGPSGVHFVLLEAEPQTGRTHQIRLHCQHLGIPLVGDVKYGGIPDASSFSLMAAGKTIPCSTLRLPTSGHALHAATIEIVHPRNRTKLHFCARLPLWATSIQCSF